MAQTYGTILTPAGVTAFANAATNGTKVAISFAGIGDGNGAEYLPADGQTALKNQVYNCPVNSMYIDPSNPNWIDVDIYLAETVGGWFIREVSIEDNNHVPLAIGTYPSSYKPVTGAGSAVGTYIKFVMQVTNASLATLTIDPSVVLATRQYVDAQDAKDLPLTGGTLTGSLDIAPASGPANLGIDAAADATQITFRKGPGKGAYIVSATGSSVRWSMQLGDGGAEGGSNAGSDFRLVRFNDSGAVIDQPLVINRATGKVQLTQNLAIGGYIEPAGNAPVGVLWGNTFNGVYFNGNLYSDGTNWRAMATGYASSFSVPRGGVGTYTWYGTTASISAGTVAALSLLATLTPKANFTVGPYTEPANIAAQGGDIFAKSFHGVNVGGNSYYDGTQSRAIAAGYVSSYSFPQSTNGSYIWAISPVQQAADAPAGFNNVMTLDQTANLTLNGLSASNPTITLNAFPSPQANYLQGRKNGVPRWTISPGDGTAEGGSNAGSLFLINSNNDAGTYNFTLMGGSRANGVATFPQPIVNGSDSRLKDHVRPIKHALETVERLKGVSFHRLGQDKDTREIGFLAQDLREIVPESVQESSLTLAQVGGKGDDPMLAVSYGPMVALLAEAVKELSAKVKELEAKLK